MDKTENVREKETHNSWELLEEVAVGVIRGLHAVLFKFGQHNERFKKFAVLKNVKEDKQLN